MSAEADFRALLVAHPGLAALVGTRISENAVPQGLALPYVAFGARHELTHNLLGDVMADQATLTVQCWGRNATEAAAVAAQVALAVEGAEPARGAVVISTEGAYDAQTDADASILVVEWWAL
jgi:hypothetical protein